MLTNDTTGVAAPKIAECVIKDKRLAYHACSSRPSLKEAKEFFGSDFKYLGSGKEVYLDNERKFFETTTHFFANKKLMFKPYWVVSVNNWLCDASYSGKELKAKHRFPSFRQFDYIRSEEDLRGFTERKEITNKQLIEQCLNEKKD